MIETTSSQHLTACNLTNTGERAALLNTSLAAHKLGQILVESTYHRWGPLVGWEEADSTGIGTLPLKELAEEPAQSQEEKGTCHSQHHHKPGLWLPESLHVCHKQGCHH